MPTGLKLKSIQIPEASKQVRAPGGQRVVIYYTTTLPVWYENLSGVVSCPENSNINTDGLDSVVIGSRDQ